jgi:hypothetical protein
MNSKIPRRASRNIWHRLKRWWHRLWHRGAVIYFDEAAKKGVGITFTYTGSAEIEEREWDEIVNKPHVRNALRRMAKESASNKSF